jgi:hypothetical protein
MKTLNFSTLCSKKSIFGFGCDFTKIVNLPSQAMGNWCFSTLRCGKSLHFYTLYFERFVNTNKEYIYILFSAFFITILSFIIELFYPFIKNLYDIRYLIGVFVFRLIHFFVFIYFSAFIFLFNLSRRSKPNCKNKTNIVIYLLCVVLMVLSWKFYKYCPATYYEFKMYEVNELNYHTTFHPALFSIFREYSDYIIYITGLLMSINVIYILYNETWIPNIIKKIYIIIFSYLFFSTILEHRRPFTEP